MKGIITHITTVHSPFDVRIFHKECKTLANVGYDVTLIAQHDKDEMVDGVRIIALPKPKSRFQRMLRLPLTAFRLSVKRKADVYHFHDPELIPVGVLLKFFTKGKVIYDVHEDYAKQTLSKPYIPKVARKIVAFLIKLIEYISSRLFDSIVTVTNDILKNFSYHPKATTVKNYPIISRLISKKKDLKSNEKIFNLIYIGGLTKIRGIAEIVKALELLILDISVRLILCGEFSPNQYEMEIKCLKGFEKAEYLGWVEPKKIPDLLSMSDAGLVCLHPIRNYLTALPVKLFEYMAVGLPVIASNFPLWKEIIVGNNCGICVDPLKPEEIARAIEYLIQHPGEARQMGENGRKAVEKKYNWEKESEKLVELYERLLQA